MLIHLTTTGRYSSRGFTLIEVLCTLAMLSILSALAVPAMADMAARHRIDGLRAELIQSIQGARSEALARGQTVTLSRLTGCSTALVGASDWGCGWVTFVDMDADGAEEAGDVRLQMVSLPAGVRLAKPTSPNGSQQFNHFGQSVTLGQRFELSPVDTRYSVLAGSICFSTGTRLRYKPGTGAC